eukprot:542294_1
MWLDQAIKSWKEVEVHLSPLTLPPRDIYGDEHWESTIRVIFFHHLRETAAYALERALGDPNISDYHRAIGITLSASLGEACYAWDKDKPNGAAAASTLKNLGNAYMSLVRSTTSVVPWKRQASLASITTSSSLHLLYLYIYMRMTELILYLSDLTL